MMSQKISILLILVCVFVLTSQETILDEFQNEIQLQFENIKKAVQDELWNEDLLNEIKMFDSWAKFPSGILAGNLYELGNFDECYNLEFTNAAGKYCLGTLPISAFGGKFYNAFKYNETMKKISVLHPQPRGLTELPDYLTMNFGICVPHTVDLTKIPGILTFDETFCYSKKTEPELTNGAVAMIVIFAIFLAIIVASTTYDIILDYTNKKPKHELLIAFSFLTNGRKLFKSSKNPDQLLCLNGIRALSMMWVIFGHIYDNVLSAPFSNLLDAVNWQKQLANMIINGATVSVDTFFTVGGLVTMYVFLKSMDKGVKFNIIMFYVHRYLRLTPIFAMIGLYHMYLLTYLSVGPLWQRLNVTMVNTCKDNWWSSFLYITNYVRNGTCLPQSWYLSIDMQLYILSPIVLLTLHKSKKIGIALLSVLICAGVVVPFAVVYTGDIGSLQTEDTRNFMNVYYIQTYNRFGPYVIGMLAGYFIYKIKTGSMSIKLSPLQIICAWLICLAGIVACVYGGFPVNTNADPPPLDNAFFQAFSRNGWAIFVLGVVFLCVAGYGGPIDVFLSLPIFQILTKVSYAMYLVHYTVIFVRNSTSTVAYKFSNLQIMHTFWGDFMLTFVISLVVSLAFESPIIILEKYIFGRDNPRPQKEIKKPEA